MSQITIKFTKNNFSIVSYFVRWVLPRSRFSLALSSHCYIYAGDKVYQAVPFKGVCCGDEKSMVGNDKIVKLITYDVPNLQAGIDFLTEQLGKGYDYKGVIGLGLGTTRDWGDDNSWFCYELAAGALKGAGLDVFNDLHLITETPLMAIK